MSILSESDPPRDAEVMQRDQGEDPPTPRPVPSRRDVTLLPGTPAAPVGEDSPPEAGAWWSAWSYRFVRVVPLLAVNGVAVFGQLQYALEDIAPDDWATGPQWALAVGFAGAIESVALTVGYHAHDALINGATATAARLRRASYGVAGVVAAINYAHWSTEWPEPSSAAVGFGMLSLASPWLWGLHTRRVQRKQLLDAGAVDGSGVTFSAERIRAFPILTWRARRWSILHNVDDPAAAWVGYLTEREARRAARRANQTVAGDALPAPLRWFVRVASDTPRYRGPAVPPSEVPGTESRRELPGRSATGTDGSTGTEYQAEAVPDPVWRDSSGTEVEPSAVPPIPPRFTHLPQSGPEYRRTVSAAAAPESRRVHSVVPPEADPEEPGPEDIWTTDEARARFLAQAREDLSGNPWESRRRTARDEEPPQEHGEAPDPEVSDQCSTGAAEDLTPKEADALQRARTMIERGELKAKPSGRLLRQTLGVGQDVAVVVARVLKAS